MEIYEVFKLICIVQTIGKVLLNYNLLVVHDVNALLCWLAIELTAIKRVPYTILHIWSDALDGCCILANHTVTVYVTRNKPWSLYNDFKCDIF